MSLIRYLKHLHRLSKIHTYQEFCIQEEARQIYIEAAKRIKHETMTETLLRVQRHREMLMKGYN